MELRESQFRQWLKNRLISSGAFVTNIESSTKNGIPDMYVVLRRQSFWLELKADKNRSVPLIRPEQRIWGMKHHKSGGLAWFLHYVEPLDTCYFYMNPIDNVRVVGKYLEVLDPPTAVCARSEVVQMLYRLLDGAYLDL